MTRNEPTMDRHASTESSWSARSGDTVRPYGRHGSLRGTPVTVKTAKDPNAPYVYSRCAYTAPCCRHGLQAPGPCCERCATAATAAPRASRLALCVPCMRGCCWPCFLLALVEQRTPRRATLRGSCLGAPLAVSLPDVHRPPHEPLLTF